MPAFSFLFLPLVLAIGAFAQTKPITPAFDSVAVHHVYLEGEFAQAIQMLEPALKRKNLTHGDSVFIFKHLGVIYAASEDTREKGKYYMYKLIETEPLSNILDMYASDMIYMIFKNVKDEYEAARNRMERAQKFLGRGVHGAGTDSAMNDRASSKPVEQPVAEKRTSSGRQAFYWLGSAGVAAAVGVSMFVYLHEEDKPAVEKKVYGLD